MGSAEVAVKSRREYAATIMVAIWLEGHMPTTLTLKNIPDDLYERLKAAASVHRRSLNGEAIVCLERALGHAKISAEERLERIRRVRAQLPDLSLSDAEIDAMKREGRE
jgi:plasmid stability protein